VLKKYIKIINWGDMLQTQILNSVLKPDGKFKSGMEILSETGKGIIAQSAFSAALGYAWSVLTHAPRAASMQLFVANSLSQIALNVFFGLLHKQCGLSKQFASLGFSLTRGAIYGTLLITAVKAGVIGTPLGASLGVIYALGTILLHKQTLNESEPLSRTASASSSESSVSIA